MNPNTPNFSYQSSPLSGSYISNVQIAPVVAATANECTNRFHIGSENGSFGTIESNSRQQQLPTQQLQQRTQQNLPPQPPPQAHLTQSSVLPEELGANSKPRATANAFNTSVRVFGCGMCLVVIVITVTVCLLFAGVIAYRVSTRSTTTTTTVTPPTRDVSNSPPTNALDPRRLASSATEIVIPLRIIQHQGKIMRAPVRSICPPPDGLTTTTTTTTTAAVDRVATINTFVLQPDSSLNSLVTSLPNVVELGHSRLVCSFETRMTSTMSWYVYTEIPRTTCANVECACSMAMDTWSVISVYNQGATKTAAAYTLAEESNDDAAIVLFELATITHESGRTGGQQQQQQSPDPSPPVDLDQQIYPPLCHLIIERDTSPPPHTKTKPT